MGSVGLKGQGLEVSERILPEEAGFDLEEWVESLWKGGISGADVKQGHREKQGDSGWLGITGTPGASESTEARVPRQAQCRLTWAVGAMEAP